MPEDEPQNSSTPALQRAFGATTPSPPVSPPDAALIIDFAGAREGADYLKKLGETVEDLRARHIPIIWVSMTNNDRNRLHRPDGTPPGPDSPPRSKAELDQEGYHDPGPAEREFLDRHGPRANETIYEKFFKSALIDPKDYENNQAMQGLLLSDIQLKYQEEMKKKFPTAANADSLADYMQQMGYKRPLILGTVSNNCCIDTASWAVKKGMSPIIASDGVVSWNVDETKEKIDYDKHHTIWRGKEDDSSWNDFHTAKMKARAETIATAEKDARGLSDEQASRIRNIEYLTVDEALAGAPVIETAPAVQRTSSAAPAPVPARG